MQIRLLGVGKSPPCSEGKSGERSSEHSFSTEKSSVRPYYARVRGRGASDGRAAFLFLALCLDLPVLSTHMPLLGHKQGCFSLGADDVLFFYTLALACYKQGCSSLGVDEKGEWEQ